MKTKTRLKILINTTNRTTLYYQHLKNYKTIRRNRSKPCTHIQITIRQRLTERKEEWPTASEVVFKRDGLLVASLSGLWWWRVRNEAERQRRNQNCGPSRNGYWKNSLLWTLCLVCGGFCTCLKKKTMINGPFVYAPNRSHGRWNTQAMDTNRPMPHISLSPSLQPKLRLYPYSFIKPLVITGNRALYIYFFLSYFLTFITWVENSRGRKYKYIIKSKGKLGI